MMYSMCTDGLGVITTCRVSMGTDMGVTMGCKGWEVISLGVSYTQPLRYLGSAPYVGCKLGMVYINPT